MLPNWHLLFEEISLSELTLTSWVKSSAKTTNWDLAGSLACPVSNPQPVTALHNRRLTIFWGYAALQIDFSLKDSGSLLDFLYMHFLLPLLRECWGLHLGYLNNKDLLKRVLSAGLWQSCQTIHHSRMHFRSYSALHTTLQQGSPFQWPEFGTGIWQ